MNSTNKVLVAKHIFVKIIFVWWVLCQILTYKTKNKNLMFKGDILSETERCAKWQYLNQFIV